MRIIECDQTSEEWFNAKIGIPSASMFDKILTPTGKASTQANVYANQLIAETIKENKLGFQGNKWTDRGIELEPEARNYYEFITENEVEQVGFILIDSGIAGCSPDGLINRTGGIEIKCPKDETHIEYLIDNKAPTKYKPQIQGQMYIAELEWVDFISYNPDIKPLIVRTYRDEKYIKLLSESLEKFNELLESKKTKLIHNGIMEG